MALIDGETRGKGGRKCIPTEYRKGEIDGNECIIGTVITKGERLDFFIDCEDEERVKTRQWSAATGGKYIGTNVVIEGKKKTLCLHNFVMNRLFFPGKGVKESIDHINRNGLDNRKCNLRLVTQSEQNVNKKPTPRTSELPEGIEHPLPKYIWYIKANGLHGDGFGVDMKTKGIKWKTTRSRKVPIQEKLDQAKKKVDELILKAK